VIAAAFDGVGLVLLIPILSIVTASGGDTSPIHRITVEALDLAGAHTRIARLSALLGLFAVLIVVRAVLVTRRDMTLGTLQQEFFGLDPRPAGRAARRSALAGGVAAAACARYADLDRRYLPHRLCGLQRDATRHHGRGDRDANRAGVSASVVTDPYRALFDRGWRFQLHDAGPRA
jgi:hypothetical protein